MFFVFVFILSLPLSLSLSLCLSPFSWPHLNVCVCLYVCVCVYVCAYYTHHNSRLSWSAILSSSSPSRTVLGITVNECVVNRSDYKHLTLCVPVWDSGVWSYVLEDGISAKLMSRRCASFGKTNKANRPQPVHYFFKSFFLLGKIHKLLIRHFNECEGMQEVGIFPESTSIW